MGSTSPSPNSNESFDWLILPEERRAPIITVQDAASHALSFLGGIFGVPVISLGVDEFGQSGRLGDLYHATGIDVEVDRRRRAARAGADHAAIAIHAMHLS